jgi:hypothetical protein
MKLDKIIFDVREALKEYSDDTELSDKYITYLYDIKRAKYIRQDVNNSRRSIDISIKQNLCLELEEVNVNECGVELGCKKIIRTKRPIPTPLQLHNKSALTRIASTDRIARPFNFITGEKAIYAVDAPYPNAVYAFLHHDEHIYITSNSPTIKLMSCINVTGVFEHPLDLQNYNTSCNADDVKLCYDISTSEYPIQPHYIDIIRTEIISEILKLANVPEDKMNDSNDE